MEITEELQAVIDAAVAKATEGLKNKNNDLIAREKAAKKTADEAEQAREVAATEAAEKAGDVEKIKSSYQTKYDKDTKALNEKIVAHEKRLSELLIDNAIASAITANGVRPHFSNAVSLMLKNGAEMIDGRAMVGDVAFEDHIAAWMKSSEAKYYVAAPANTGAGASGSSAVATPMSKAPETAEEWNTFYKLAAENPAQANALADQWGTPELKS